MKNQRADGSPHYRQCSYVPRSSTPSPYQYTIRSTIGSRFEQSYKIGKGYKRDIFVEKLPFITPGPDYYIHLKRYNSSPKVAIKIRYGSHTELTPGPNYYSPLVPKAAHEISLGSRVAPLNVDAGRSPGPCAYFYDLHVYQHNTGHGYKMGPNGGQIDRLRPRDPIMRLTCK